MRLISFALVTGLLLVLPSDAMARSQTQDLDSKDWPQWRGPQRTGVSGETGWSAVGRPEPLWRKELGLGHSSFAIAAGRVYTLGYDAEAGMDHVYCFDAATGEEIWRHSYASEIWDMAHDGGTQTTPTVVGDVVYTSNREGKLFCLNVADGSVRWMRDARAEKELEPPTWGFSASPLVVGDRVIMNVDRVLAYDRETGADLWSTEKQYGIAYSTPAVFELNGEQLLASLSGDGLVVLSLEEGVEIDFYEWIKTPQIYPMTPVVIGDKIFISAGYDRGCTMLKLVDGRLEEQWASRVMRNKMSGCVLFEDHLYGFDESILKCVALDGTMRWRARGLGTGSMTIAGGRLVILDGKGQLIIAEASPNGYVELSRQQVFEEGTSWSSPVLSNGRVYCRSSKGSMACLDYRASAAPVTASANAPEAMTLSAKDVLARHGAAIAREGNAAIRSIHMSGPGESLRNTAQAGQVDLDWSPERGFSWRDTSGFQLAHITKTGWLVGGGSAPEIFEGKQLEAMQEAGDLSRLFDLSGGYASFGEPRATVFDNRDCYVLGATTEEGEQRQLYFERESGLYAGYDGDDILMWTVGDYREFDGVLLPTRWAFFEPENGEMNSAVFNVVEINVETETDPFAIPPAVKLFQRTPEELAADNSRLTEEYGDILGNWRGEEDPPEAPGTSLEVRDGFVNLVQSERGISPLIASETPDKLVLFGKEYVSFTIERGDEGKPIAIQIRIGPEARDRLIR